MLAIGKQVEWTRHRVLCTLEWADEAGKFHIHKAQPSQSVYNIMHIAIVVCVKSTCSRGVEKKSLFFILFLFISLLNIINIKRLNVEEGQAKANNPTMRLGSTYSYQKFFMYTYFF